MTRRTNNGDGNATVKLRLIEFEVEGGNPAIIESLRTMTTALSRQRPVLASPSRAMPAAGGTQEKNADAESSQPEFDFGNGGGAEPEPIETVAEGSTRTQRPPRSPRKPQPAPELVQLDFDVGAFREFVTKIGTPTDHWHRYLAIAYFLKRHYKPSIASIKINHVFTVYRLLNWTAPTDLALVLRDLTRKKQWFVKDDAGWTITLIGENEIDGLTNAKSKK